MVKSYVLRNWCCSWNLWLCWWARSLLSNAQGWCLSVSDFEVNEYISEYIHFAVNAKCSKFCYQTTSYFFFCSVFLSLLYLIQHSRNFSECQRKLLIGEFLRVIFFFVCATKRRNFWSVSFHFEYSCNGDRASNCCDLKGLVFMLNLPIVEFFQITSDLLILVHYVNEVILGGNKRLIWFSITFKECFRNINQPCHLCAPEGIVELI